MGRGALRSPVYDCVMSSAAPRPDRFDVLAAGAPVASLPGLARGLQPSSTLYGGAQRFRPGALGKLGERVVEAVDMFVASDDEFVACFGMPTAASVTSMRERLRTSLLRAPLEDVRVDFEDGYGPHGDVDEDAHAALVGEALAEGRASPWPARVGIRLRPLERATSTRALRTLTIVVDTMVARGWRPGVEPLRITLPKVERVEELALAAAALESLEQTHGLPDRSFVLEAMVETAHALVDEEGRLPLVRWPVAARGRLAALHFGAFDFTASLGVPARSQSLDHPACVHARRMMALAAARADLEVSDGTFLEIPVGPHRDAAPGSSEDRENREVVQRAFRHHGERVRRQLAEGFRQGWDLHPGQVVSRRAAVLMMYVEGRDQVLRRMDSFLASGAKAVRTGTAFDDAASARALLAELRRGLRLGLDDADIVSAFLHVSSDDLLHASLADLAARRRVP